MSYAICSIRLIGDAALALSFPVLIARVLARGNGGISTTSQVLHLIVFLLRYSDLQPYMLNIFFQRGLDWETAFYYGWTPLLKVYLIAVAALALVVMMYKQVKTKGLSVCRLAQQCTVAALRPLVLCLLPAFFLGYRLNYASYSILRYNPSAVQDESFSWISALSHYFSLSDLFNSSAYDALEVAWATSIYLGAIADIPQYIKYHRYSRTKIDWWLMAPTAMLAFSRMLYIFHWINRYVHDQVFEPIAFVAALIQVFAFWMFFVLVISKVNDVFSESHYDLEAQLEEYDSARWGVEEPRIVLVEFNEEK